MSKVSFVLVIHSHQPVGNFDHVIEAAYQKSYLPFAQTLAAHPRIRLSLHYSGILLEWIEARHAEYFQLIRRLVERGQVELLGGGFYEPILLVIPDADKLAQLRKLADYIQKHFGAKPGGAWVAERVWEPGLAMPLAEAGVQYTILDDTHFLSAGLEPSRLHGVYITEEGGKPLRLVPSLKDLRYTIPFREPEETLRILHKGIDLHSKLFAMGDDCEKFGVWPGTYDHVYTNGWLERFFQAIEEAEDWLETATVSDFLAANAPLGTTYLPGASYAEMMEWALPFEAARDFKAALDATEPLPSGARIRRFLRGGIWRNFLAKYSESNQIHKLMLGVSRRCEEAGRSSVQAPQTAQLLSEARNHLLAGQCNDPYWHGVFGGLYAPHLRSAVLRNLIQAENLLDKIEGAGKTPRLNIQALDFDVDGHNEYLITHPVFAMVLRPSDGGTISSLRFKPADAELINSLMRRPEPYHDLVRQRVASHEAPREGPASIHDHVLSKESNLAALIRYDRYARHVFRTFVFPAGKTWKDFDYLRLDESPTLAGGPWTLSQPPEGSGEILSLATETLCRVSGETLPMSAEKIIETRVVGSLVQLACRSTITPDRPCPAPLVFGVELVFNLLASDAPDRYFLANDARHPLEFRGEIAAPNLSMIDEWQRVRISLDATPEARWWVVPIETISQSESGFERVYQGSAILAVWNIDHRSRKAFTCDLRAAVESFQRT